jgi:hypothetical protein
MTEQKHLFTDGAVYTFLFTTLGFGIAYCLADNERKMYKQAAEEFSSMELQAYGKTVNNSIPPQLRDANFDGIDDIVLQRNNGEELILYGTPRGNYIFGEDGKGEGERRDERK